MSCRADDDVLNLMDGVLGALRTLTTLHRKIEDIRGELVNERLVSDVLRQDLTIARASIVRLKAEGEDP